MIHIPQPVVAALAAHGNVKDTATYRGTLMVTVTADRWAVTDGHRLALFWPQKWEEAKAEAAEKKAEKKAEKAEEAAKPEMHAGPTVCVSLAILHASLKIAGAKGTIAIGEDGTITATTGRGAVQALRGVVGMEKPPYERVVTGAENAFRRVKEPCGEVAVNPVYLAQACEFVHAASASYAAVKVRLGESDLDPVAIADTKGTALVFVMPMRT